mmetsp:Transcript_42636/g.134243  ORF Transcript_42636/g.134243 Transcript_42636/m.134243 type:complete len:250 (-) Transcript_42636:2442-3191(-)
MMQQLLKERKLTQRELNRLYEGPEYLLSKRYGSMLNIMFVIFTYASSIPTLYFFGIVFFVTAYWCDKIAILRAVKKPAQYDEKLAVFCTNMMSVGTLIHLAFGSWFFGYIEADDITALGLPSIFKKIFVEDVMSGLGTMFVTKFSKAPSFFFYISFIIYLSFEIISRSFGPALYHLVLKRIGRESVEEIKEGNPTFFEALENQELSGLDTYNIKKNDRYKDAFTSDVAEDNDEDLDEEDEEDDFGEGKG